MERILFMRFPEGKAKAFTLSYDDGVDLDARLIALFDKHSLKATFNINSGLYSAEGATRPDGYFYRLSRSQASALYNKNGHEIATHGYTHPWLEQLSIGSITYEIAKDREALEEQFGCIVRGHAYPFGTFNDTVVEALRACGIVYARTVNSTENFEMPTDWLRLDPTCHHDNKRVFELIHNFVEAQPARRPKLFYLWGHSFEFDKFNNWDRIEKICDAISGKDDVWYANNIEIYEYTKAYESLVWAANMRRVHNPGAKKIWFKLNGKIYSIEPDETLVIE
jgi:peptidoglycan/xylan/chitin deacetylase (PgdA/CDA1 family)